jgi:hypothetical protein
MNDDNEYIGVFQIKLKKKFYGLDQIDEFAHNGKPKETKTLIILTHLARRFFIPKTFFTENYKDKIVVYGSLKPQYKHLQGGSIFSKVKDLVQKGISKVKEFFSPRLDNFNNVSTRVLKTYGDVPVSDILIYRTPIPSMLNTALNLVSFGKWNELRSKYGFDKLFHLSLVFRLSNGKMIIVEKNEVVNINDTYTTKPDTEVFQVTGYSGGKTLYDFINGARQKVNNDKLFFGYDAFTNNCQFFIRYILEAAGLYSEAAKNFLFQDISKIVEGLSPTTKAIAKGITDLGAVVSKISGKGKKVGGSGYRKNMIVSVQQLRNGFETLVRDYPLTAPLFSVLEPKINQLEELTNRKVITQRIIDNFVSLYDEVEQRLLEALRRNRGSGKPRKSKKIGGADREQPEGAAAEEPAPKKKFTEEQYNHTKKIIYARGMNEVDKLRKLMISVTKRNNAEIKQIRDKIASSPTSGVVLRKDAIKRFNKQIDEITSNTEQNIARLKSQIRDTEDQLRARLRNTSYIAQQTILRLTVDSRDNRGPPVFEYDNSEFPDRYFPDNIPLGDISRFLGLPN